MKNAKYLIVIVIIAVIAIPLFLILTPNQKVPGKYDEFAQCLTEKSAVMYGAYWCDHCAAQKDMLGKSFQYINYIECDSRGKNANPQLCAQKNIQGYPTWEINEKFYRGVQSLEKLSEASGCSLK